MKKIFGCSVVDSGGLFMQRSGIAVSVHNYNIRAKWCTTQCSLLPVAIGVRKIKSKNSFFFLAEFDALFTE